MVKKKWFPMLVWLALFAGTGFLHLPVNAEENWFQKGLNALQEQRYDDAIKAFTRSIEALPQDYEAYNNRGIAWFYANEFEKAIEDYSQAIELNPEFTQAYNNRGAAWFYIKEFQKAVDDCSRVIKLQPEDYEAYNYRGTARYYLKEYRKAIADCSRAIELNPEYSVAYDRLAVMLTLCPDKSLRNPDRAVVLARKATMLSPEAEYLDTLAAAYAQAGDLRKAVQTQKKAIENLKRENRTTQLPAFTKRLQKYRSLETRQAKNGIEKPAKKTAKKPEKKPEKKTAQAGVSQPPSSEQNRDIRPSASTDITYPAGRLPFLIQIGSFKDRKVAAEKALRYAAKGDPTFTSPAKVPGKGEWYRVFSGCYTDAASAEQALTGLKQRKFKAPFVTRLPYSVIMGSFFSKDALQDTKGRLQRLGYVSLVWRDSRYENVYWLISGAFADEEEAAHFSRWLAAGGFGGTVVRR